MTGCTLKTGKSKLLDIEEDRANFSYLKVGGLCGLRMVQRASRKLEKKVEDAQKNNFQIVPELAVCFR